MCSLCAGVLVKLMGVIVEICALISACMSLLSSFDWVAVDCACSPFWWCLLPGVVDCSLFGVGQYLVALLFVF